MVVPRLWLLLLLSVACVPLCEAAKVRNGKRYFRHVSFSNPEKEGHMRMEGHDQEFEHLPVETERPKHMVYVGLLELPKDRMKSIEIHEEDVDTINEWLADPERTKGDHNEWHFKYVFDHTEAKLVYIHCNVKEHETVHMFGLSGHGHIDRSHFNPLMRYGESIIKRRFTEEEHNLIMHNIYSAIGRGFETFLMEHPDFDFDDEELDRHEDFKAEREARHRYRRHKRDGRHEEAEKVFQEWQAKKLSFEAKRTKSRENAKAEGHTKKRTRPQRRRNLGEAEAEEQKAPAALDEYLPPIHDQSKDDDDKYKEELLRQHREARAKEEKGPDEWPLEREL